ncbi:MAG: AraC family transcriptional regulator [Cyanobacteria bacterium]|nr:AraC family transcriptional regulator [Cyanobacteriota bacterium]
MEDINRLKELLILLQEEYMNNITLKEASEKVNFSLNYFCKFFKRVVGCTFSKYLLRIRIDKAKEFLITQEISVTSIAYKVGFENLGYFYRKFKEFTGMSPTEFKYKIETLKSKYDNNSIGDKVLPRA